MIPTIGSQSIGDLEGIIPNFGSSLPKTSGTSTQYEAKYNSDTLSRKTQKIEEERWNQVFRYYFAVKMANPKTGEVSSANLDISDENANERFKSYFGLIGPYQYLFFLPPQAIQIQTQFASSVIATNRGILEENNGMVFRTITISGTTGVWPAKPFQKKGSSSLLGRLAKNIFPAATSAISNLFGQIKKTTSSIVGEGPLDLQKPDKDSGYYQFWALHNFFVAYAEAKKDPGCKNFRLVFGAPKDNIEYICTPVQFDMRRDSSNPLLYRYQIVLRAWDITTESPVGFQVPYDETLPSPDNVNVITSIVNSLRNIRGVLTGVGNVVKSVNSDIASTLLIFNQATLVLKEFGGLREDIGDFKNVFKNNSQYLLKGPNNKFYSSLQAYEAKSNTTGSRKLVFTSTEETQPLTGSSQDSSAVSTAGGAINTSQVTPGGESTQLSSSRLTVAQSVLNSALNDPDFIANPVSDFDVPPNVEDQLESTRSDARQLTSGDIRTLNNKLQEISDNYSQNTGMMDSTYATTYAVPYTPTERTPTEDDIITSASLQEAKINFASTLATGQIFRDRDLDPFAIANQNLDPQDQVDSPVSSYSVAFPRGRSLEDIAQQFLGDANRWREITLLNALRAPYIDENGFDLPIYSANGRTFVVKDVSKLTISQRITISSNSAISTTRSILNIEDIGGNQWRIMVDGQDNLSIYTPGSSPQIHARLPGCVGSGDTILIPSNSEASDFIPSKPNSLYARMTHAEKVFKIDLALDDKNARDLVVTHAGDIKRSYGYDNAAQAIRLSLETERGELEQHPSYGVAVPIGGRNSNITTQQFEQIVASRVRSDARFRDADVAASIEGSVARVSVVAQGAAGTGKVPVEFEIGKIE